jgi:di/tricarboxylate transporter
MTQQEAPTIKKTFSLAAIIKANWLPILGAIGAFVLFFIIRSMSIPGISPQGQGVLAVLLAAVVLWVTRPITITFTSLLVIIVPWALGYISPEVALSGFSNSTFWLVFAVLGMSSCIGISPLSRRLFLSILSLIGKPTYNRVLAAGFIMTFILGYFIPLHVAKAVILYTILMPIVPLFGVTYKSRVGVSLAAAFAVIPWGTMVLTPTSHVMSSLAFGTLLAEGIDITFLKWASITIVPTIVIFVLFYLFVIGIAKPESSEAIGGRDKIRKDFKALPSMDAKEIWVLIVTLGILVGWLVGLNPTLVAVIGVLLYVLPGIGVMSFSDLLAKGISWDTLLMVGAFLAITPMMEAVNLTETFKSVLGFPFTLATSPLLFVLAITLLSILAWGFMIIFPAIPIVVPILLLSQPVTGISPVLGAMMLVMFAPQFFFWITAPTFGLAMEDNRIGLKDWMLYTSVFFAIIVIVWGIWVLLVPM